MEDATSVHSDGVLSIIFFFTNNFVTLIYLTKSYGKLRWGLALKIGMRLAECPSSLPPNSSVRSALCFSRDFVEFQKSTKKKVIFWLIFSFFSKKIKKIITLWSLFGIDSNLFCCFPMILKRSKNALAARCAARKTLGLIFLDRNSHQKTHIFGDRKWIFFSNLIQMSERV